MNWLLPAEKVQYISFINVLGKCQTLWTEHSTNRTIFSQKSRCLYWFLVKTIYWVLLSSISYQLMLLVFHTNFDWLLCYPLNILRIYSNKNYLKVDITNFWYNQHEIGILGINFRFFSLIANLLCNMVLTTNLVQTINQTSRHS